MSEMLFIQIQHMIDRLTPLDQVKLMEYISSRVERVISSISPPTIVKAIESDEAWTNFFKIGDELLKCDMPESESMTSTLLSMRRR